MCAKYLSLYLDNKPGWRSYLVLSEGRKHAKLICTEDAETAKIDLATLATGKPLPLKRTRLARQLRRVAQTYGRDQSSAMKVARALLRPGAAE